MKNVLLIKLIDYKRSYEGKDGKKHPSVSVIACEVIMIDGKESYQNKVMVDLAHPKGQYAKNYRAKLFGLCDRVETIGSIEDLQ